ncbi:SDH family Clp fold serine proteinase [Treponema sp.]|uniref:SDH family Clp fold serine proteinase n=1 Tax=Treponema sp. TaxID=166 RepID=UPI00298E953B|nr:serine protease [Treponema sp.]
MNLERKQLYEAIEKERNSKLLVYVTGDKAGWETQIANDATDYISDQLDKIGVVEKISLLLFTNGGSTLAGWNIVNLIRQFCDDFEIIVPSKARSTGTLMCLGANRIIMTKQATLGPIDPSVNTPLNPTVPNAGPQARVPVSVEAIKGFLELAKHELNLKDDKALADIFNVLADKVHPLVLGEVYRAIGQIQMLARKLLVNQVKDESKIEKIISFLCSESGSHDYTINRREAKNELGLNVEKPSDSLYDLINRTYMSIREELQLRTSFNPESYLGADSSKEYTIKRTLIESLAGGTDCFVSEGRFAKIELPPQMGIQDQRIFEGWKHYD